MPSARAPTGTDGIIFPVLRIRFPIMTQITLETTAKWVAGGGQSRGGAIGGVTHGRREHKQQMRDPQDSTLKMQRLFDFIRDARTA